jgi:hypothetical protein
MMRQMRNQMNRILSNSATVTLQRMDTCELYSESTRKTSILLQVSQSSLLRGGWNFARNKFTMMVLIFLNMEKQIPCTSKRPRLDFYSLVWVRIRVGVRVSPILVCAPCIVRGRNRHDCFARVNPRPTGIAMRPPRFAFVYAIDQFAVVNEHVATSPTPQHYPRCPFLLLPALEFFVGVEHPNKWTSFYEDVCIYLYTCCKLYLLICILFSTVKHAEISTHEGEISTVPANIPTTSYVLSRKGTPHRSTLFLSHMRNNVKSYFNPVYVVHYQQGEIDLRWFKMGSLNTFQQIVRKKL